MPHAYGELKCMRTNKIRFFASLVGEMVKSYYIYSNEWFCSIYIIFDLISALKSSSFRLDMIISMPVRGIHVLEYVQTFVEKMFLVKQVWKSEFCITSQKRAGNKKKASQESCLSYIGSTAVNNVLTSL